MQRDKVTIKKLVEGPVFWVAGLAKQWRVIKFDIHTECGAFFCDFAAYIADADNADGFAFEGYFVFLSDG